MSFLGQSLAQCERTSNQVCFVCGFCGNAIGDTKPMYLNEDEFFCSDNCRWRADVQRPGRVNSFYAPSGDDSPRSPCGMRKMTSSSQVSTCSLSSEPFLAPPAPHKSEQQPRQGGRLLGRIMHELTGALVFAGEDVMKCY